MGTFRLFKLYLRVPFLILALIEFGICVLAVFVAVYARFDGMVLESDGGIDSPVISSVLFGLVMTLSMMAMGLYQSSFRGGSLGVFLRTLIGFVAGASVLALIFYMVPILYLGRGVLAISTVLAFFMVGTIRPLFLYYVDKDIIKVRVAIIGTGRRAASIDKRLRRRSDRRGFKVINYIRLDEESEHEVDSDNVISLGSKTLLEFCTENDVEELVVAMDDRRGKMPIDELLECKLSGIDVIDVLTFFEREQGKLPLDIMKPDWLIFSDGFDQGALRDLFKRSFDVGVSALLLAVVWPFMLLAWLAIKIEDGWRAPVIYRQVRTGQRNIPFSVLKFRSMSVNAEKDGKAQWASKNDSRITRVGAFLRRTRIDELPQIVNVLVGDMSFVGPRPERPEIIEELAKEIPYYHERHRVKPGITGWAQVCYPYGASINDSRHKQEFDLYYVKNHTIFLDLLILFQTAEVVFFGKGVR
ncbi:TIGR03013 family PEP-CTERM/XrtA system glycosyltransferase [Granulosicoccaceae sp. 1_MG-2023]|nr:TIGR03013 family PEP-CTERM/XrtA system glycosyltransferase [Granulosicoccaceae sp. 1_MG-2023]